MRHLLIATAAAATLLAGAANANEKLLNAAGDAFVEVGKGSVEFAKEGPEATGRAIENVGKDDTPPSRDATGTKTDQWGAGMSKPKQRVPAN